MFALPGVEPASVEFRVDQWPRRLVSSKCSKGGGRVFLTYSEIDTGKYFCYHPTLEKVILVSIRREEDNIIAEQFLECLPKVRLVVTVAFTLRRV